MRLISLVAFTCHWWVELILSGTPKPGLQHTPKKLCQGHPWGTGIWCGWICDAIIRGIDVPTSDGCSTCTSRVVWSLWSLYWVAWWLDSTPLAGSPKIFQLSKASTSGTPTTAICPICSTCGTQQLRTVDQGGIRSRHLVCSRSSKDSPWLSFSCFPDIHPKDQTPRKIYHYTAYTMEKNMHSQSLLRIHNLEIITRLNPIPV